METLFQDVRYGFRMLLKSRGVTIVAVIALALGIGANSAIFSVVDAVLVRPLPLEDADRLMHLTRLYPQGYGGSVSVTKSAFWIKQNQVFDHMAAYDVLGAGFNLEGGSEPERVQGIRVTADFFNVAGINPVVGRNFLPEEDHPGAERVVIMSQSLWQNRFGADPSLIGKPVTLNGESYTVIGIMPPFFQFSPQADLWTLLRSVPNSQDNGNMLLVAGRLKPGITSLAAQAGMDSVAQQFRHEYPNLMDDNEGIKVVPLHEQLVGDTRPALLMLLGAVGFVLLIACANVASLLLARATARQKETTIRIAVGASRARLVRQFLTESVLLGLTGGTLGLLLGLWGLEALRAIGPKNIPLLNQVAIDARVLGFTLLISGFTSVIFGLVPALEASKSDLNEILKEGSSRTSLGLGHRRARSLLVVSEIALALMLVIGAALLMRSFLHLRSINPGFNPHHVLTLQMSLTGPKYATSAQVGSFYRHALERIETLPGVEAAAIVTNLPLEDGPDLQFTIEGQPGSGSNRVTGSSQWRAISANYFRVMSTPLLRGRYFTEGDTEKASGVVIINETMARTYWPNQSPIGQHLSVEFGDTASEIVGIVTDIRETGLGVAAPPVIFNPYAQVPTSVMSLMNSVLPTCWVVRSALEPLSLSAAVKREILRVDQQQAVSNIRSMEQVVSSSIGRQNFNMLLLGIFAAIALLLAAVGIYGVMSYSAQRRTHEIGIRIALGAQKKDVVRLVVGQGMMLALTGVAIGVTAAFALTRVLSSLLYGVSTRDPMIFVGASILLAAVAFLACYVPARRATKVDPMVALRYE